MGTLKRFDLTTFCEKYNTKTFVETGAGPAWSLTYAATSGLFDKVLSVELDYETYKKFEDTYKQLPNTTVYNDTSKNFMKSVGSQIKEPTLFFLDAHFPGSEWGFYDKEPNKDVRIPLEAELRELVSAKDVSRDVFIIDDLRIYVDGPFEGGNWSNRLTLGGDGIDFIYELLGNTHTIDLMYEDQGYIVCVPKS